MNKKREDTIVELGLVLMMISLILLLITLCYIYAVTVRASPNHSYSMPLSRFFMIDPFFLEVLIFAHGLVVVLIGLLIGLLKKQENLEKKRKNAIVIVKLGVVLMIFGIIPLFYYYAIYIPAHSSSVSVYLVDPLFIGMMLFVLGLVVFFIGLLSLLICLIVRQRKQESL